MISRVIERIRLPQVFLGKAEIPDYPRFEQRFHFFTRECLDDSLLGTLDRDGQHTSREIDLPIIAPPNGRKCEWLRA